MRFKYLLAALAFFCISVRGFSQLQIVPQANAQALAQKLVGPGVTISNVSLTGSPLSTAYFYNRGGTSLGIDSGIVLSTGRVLSDGVYHGLDGNSVQLATFHTGTPGDPSLSALVAPKPTNNAVVLEFDFIPLGDTVKFKYVFSSDEYPNYNCSNFNDVFAFFISGPGITDTVNIALVPGTDIPVSINSINNGVAGSSGTIGNCTSMGTGSPFVQYYVNNLPNQYFTHNGHTVVLQAKSVVQPCQVYHLKIAIADVQDFSFDSGVFLEAESLRSDPISIINENPDIDGQPYLVEGCHSGGIKIVRSKRSPFPQPISIVFGGSAVNGTDVQQVPLITAIPANDSLVFIPITPLVDNIAEGIEVFKIYISNGCNIANLFSDSIEIQIRDYDTLFIEPSGNTGICKNESIQLNASAGYTNYQWSHAASLNNASVANPLASPLENTVYVCNASEGNCHAQDSISITIKTLALLSKTDIKCMDGQTGDIKVNGGWEWEAPLLYSINNGSYTADALFTGLPVGNHLLKIKDASGCVDSLEVSLVQSFPDLLLQDSIVTASCTGTNGKVFLSAGGGLPSYSFAVDLSGFSTDNVFTVPGGQHAIHVKDANGCITTHDINVNNDPPIIFNTTISPASCSGDPDGSVLVAAAGGSDAYTYSADGISFQPGGSFSVHTGNHVITVKDDKGCVATRDVFIPLNETVFVNAGRDTTICEGLSVPLDPATNATVFSWNAIPGLSSYNSRSPLASPAVTSMYIVNATLGICTIKDSITIHVLPAPVANAGVDSSICIGGSINLNGSGGIDYSWLPASQVSDPHIFNPVVRPSQSSHYYLSVTDAHGCISLKYDTVFIELIPAVQAFAGRDTSVTVGQPLQLLGRELGNSGVTKFEWFPSTGLNNPRLANPIALPDKDITYKLTMVTPEGCEGSDFINVKVFSGPEIYVPGGFTPNSDGKNDKLKAIPVGIKDFHYFKIFNRWGQLIFSTSNESNGWDGTINGRLQPTGSFVWIVEGVDYKGNLIQRKGSVSLIR